MKFLDYQMLSIQGKLRFWIEMPKGSMLPSDWPNVNEWDHHVAEVCEEALDEIKFLRSVAGAVSRGPSFEELKRASKKAT